MNIRGGGDRRGHNQLCQFCDKRFYTYLQLRSHVSKKHVCYYCGYRGRNKIYHHCQRGRGNDLEVAPFSEKQTSLLGVFKRFGLELSQPFTSIEKLFRFYRREISEVLKKLIITYRGIKIQFVLEVLMENGSNHDQVSNYISSKMYPLLHESDIDSTLFLIVSDLIINLNIFVSNGSFWRVVRVTEVNLHLAKYSAIRMGYGIDTPAVFKNRKGLFNIPTLKRNCFKYNIICKYQGINTKREAEKLYIYKEFEDEINNEQNLIDFTGMDDPDGVSLFDISRFERLNNKFSVNIYNFDGKKDIYPIRLTKSRKEIHSDMLRVYNEMGDWHLLLIKDFSGFFANCRQNKKYYCRSCLHGFLSREKRDKHSEICGKYVKNKIVFPKADFFSKSTLRQRWAHPTWVCADFETVIQKKRTHDEMENNSRVDGVHVPISFGLVEISGDKPSFYKTFVGIDCEVKFLEYLLKRADAYLEEMNAYPHFMRMSNADAYDFATARKCCICYRNLLEQSEVVESSASFGSGVGLPPATATDPTAFGEEARPEVRNRRITVRHHDHFFRNEYSEQARYIGAAHMDCNLQQVSKKRLVVGIHNLKSFDSIIIAGAIGKMGLDKVTAIAKSSEKFLTLTIAGKLQFIDTCAHMLSPLDTLVEDLKTDGFKKFKITRGVFEDLSNHDLKKMIGKLAFPYEYLSLANLNEQRDSLPPIEDFFSKLKNSNVNEEHYTRSCKVYKRFGCKSLADYIRIYNLLDCTLLGDVFQNYRNQCRDYYDVDPLNYISMPQMSFATAMAQSRQKLQLVKDMDLYLLVKEARKGGICHVNKRYFKANTPGATDYDPTQRPSHIIQADINRLYSDCMRHCLPVGGYRYLTAEEILKWNPADYEIDGPKGFIIKANFKIPHDKHDYFNALPLLPEHATIPLSKGSNLQEEFVEDLNLPSYFGKDQYILTLYDKKDYVLFLPMLKLALKMGYEMTHIETIVEFDQKPFLKDFVDVTTKRRNEAKSKAAKQLFKTVLNSCYGTFGIDPLKFTDLKFVTDMERAIDLIRQHNFESFTIINELLSIVKMGKTKVVMKNNAIVAAAILDFSKYYFYKFVYCFLDHFKGNIELGSCDTDSATLLIYCEDIYKELSELKLDGVPLIDFSFLNPDHPYYSESCKGTPGRAKLETGSENPVEYVAIKKKQYAFRFDSGKADKLRMKGVPRAFTKDVNFETYKSTLFDKKVKRIKLHMLRSLKLQLSAITSHRLAFSPVCDSRYLVPPFGIDTMSFGHKDLLEQGVVESVLEENDREYSEYESE